VREDVREHVQLDGPGHAREQASPHELAPRESRSPELLKFPPGAPPDSLEPTQASPPLPVPQEPPSRALRQQASPPVQPPPDAP
jgi:hypothetical protein